MACVHAFLGKRVAVPVCSKCGKTPDELDVITLQVKLAIAKKKIKELREELQKERSSKGGPT